ncbi:MAG TPA: methylated-DNA--[protein]-cysteine S-methyltransferase [Kofleriaceae bacterium]|nr:methylated-DNA--[protein]-cysteine S-methyltransferase [Kofleriaceae bacterium]
MTVKSPIGELVLVGSASALAVLQLPNSGDPAPDVEPGTTPVLARVARQLDEYFAGERTTFDVPLAAKGTAFQQRVWDALVAIPYGALCSYGDVARTIGRPSASRAVGAANGRNPIAIIVPCHRVIGSSGQLTGYGGGLPTKRWLLAHEQKRAGSQQRLFG